MKVCDIMTDRVVTVGHDEPVSAAASLLKRHNIGALPVCDGSGMLKGIITDRDIVMRCVAADSDPRTTRVSEIMSQGVVTAGPFDTVNHTAEIMSDDQIRRIPVVDSGKIVGIVSLCDMARNDDCEMEASEALTEISSNIKRK